MTNAEGDLKPELEALAAELVAQGLGEGHDFFLSGRPVGLSSSELVGLTPADEGGFEVWYRDMGVKRTIRTTRSFAEARAVLVREAVRLAAQRGYGPEAPRRPSPRPAPKGSWWARLRRR